MNKQKHPYILKYCSKGLLCLILFGLLTQKARAEAQIDSLQKIWSNEAEPDSNRYAAMYEYYVGYSYAYPDSVLTLSRFHYEMAEQRANQIEMLKALDNRALAYLVLSEGDSAMSYLMKALEIVISLGDSAHLGRHYSNIGSVYRNQSNYLEAVRYYNLGLSILKELKMELQEADVLNNLGLVYFDIRRFDLSLGYLKQALDLYQELGLEDKMGNIWLNIGAVKFEQGEHEPCILQAQKALEILQAEHNLFSVANTYRLLAQAHQKLGQNDSARQYIGQSLEIFQEMEHEPGIMDNKIFLANLLIEQDVAAAQKLGEEVLVLGKGKTGNIWKRDLYQLLYRCYKAQEKYTLSLEMNEKYKLYSDSLDIELNDIAVVREAIKGEFELALLQNQQESEQAQAQLKQSQRKERYSLFIIGVVLIGLVLFYSRMRTLTYRKKQTALLSEIDRLKNYGKSSVVMQSKGFQLNRDKIEDAIEKPLNETDWKVLNLLLSDPVISNKEIANQAFMSVDGIGSALRRMYSAFEIKESRYKKISLLIETIKISNS